MSDVRSKVVLGIDVNEFRRGITQVDSSIKGISRQFQNLGGIIGASFAVGHIINFGKEAVKMASEFEQVAKGFQRFGSEAELQGLRKATRGLVTDLELMKAAVTAGNFAIPVQRLGNLLDFATRRANETGQQHQRRLVGVDGMHQGLVKSSPRIGLGGVSLVAHHLGGQAQVGSHLQALGLWSAADHRTHTGLEFVGPIIALGSECDGSHVGAAARNQNHDVAHGVDYHERPQSGWLCGKIARSC